MQDCRVHRAESESGKTSWTVQAADLNHTENLWDHLEHADETQDGNLQIVAELQPVRGSAWAKSTLKNRIGAVFKSERRWTCVSGNKKREHGITHSGA